MVLLAQNRHDFGQVLGLGFCDVIASNLNSALISAQEPANDGQQRGFSSAIWSHQRGDTTSRDLQVHRTNGYFAGVVFANLL